MWCAGLFHISKGFPRGNENEQGLELVVVGVEGARRVCRAL